MIKKKHVYEFANQIGRYYSYSYSSLKFLMPRLSASQKEKVQMIVTAVISETDTKLLEMKFIKKELKVSVTALQKSSLNEDRLNFKIQHALDNFLHMNQLHPKFDDRNFVHNKIIRLNRLVLLTAQADDGEVFGVPLEYNEKIKLRKITMLPREIRDENLDELRSKSLILVQRFSFHVKDNGEHQLDLFLQNKREVKSVIASIGKNSEITFYTLLSHALTISY